MTRLVTACVLATLVATPAFAQHRHKISAEAAAARANGVYDYSPLAVDNDTVVYEGRIVGRDPDPNVRLSIIRDPRVDAF